MANRIYNKPTNNIINKSDNFPKKAKYTLKELFKNNIKLDELSITVPVEDHTAEAYNNSINNVNRLVGIEYPLIKIGEHIFSDNEILSLEIDCTGFLPTINFNALLLTNVFSSFYAPKDGDIISLAIRNPNDKLRIIRADFIVTSYLQSTKSTELNDLNPYSINVYGYLYVPKLDSYKYMFSNVGTTFETLYKLAKELNLGFVTNEDNTDDKQIWLCARDTPNNFIQDTVLKAYKDDRSFYDCWIDIYYNLNFVNVDKLLLSSEDEFDIATYLSNTSVEFVSNKDTTNKKTAIGTYKILSNLPIYRASSFYIQSWKPIAQTSSIIFDAGATAYVQLYEHNDKLYKNDKKKFWNIKTEPSYDEQKLDNYIILRGRAKQPENSLGKTQVKYNFVDMYETYPWMGIQYTISNPEDDPILWDGNHHKNYMRAKVQNTMNLRELDKLKIHVNVLGTNSNIIRGDKIPIMIFSANSLDAVSTTQDTKLDNFYSGWYMVNGYYINWDNEDMGMSSKFSQTYVLARREWPTPIPVKK